MFFFAFIITFQAYTEDTNKDGLNDKLKGRIRFTSIADNIINVGIIIPLNAKFTVCK